MMTIPSDLDFSLIDGLSNEIRQKLQEVAPSNLARAGRIPGVTPAALSILLIYLKKRELGSRLRATANG
jgi:tRNA uridine 5-carboxymethylaminomethyl modification enzyme